MTTYPLTTLFYVAIVWLTILGFNWLWFGLAILSDLFMAHILGEYEKIRLRFVGILSHLGDPMWRKRLAYTEYYLNFKENYETENFLKDTLSKREKERLLKEYKMYEEITDSKNLRLLNINELPDDLGEMMADQDRSGDYPN